MITNSTKTSINQKNKIYSFINGTIALILLTITIVHLVLCLNAIKSVGSSKQQLLTDEANRLAASDQVVFLENNQAMVQVIDKALPSQNEIVTLIKKVEALQEKNNLSGTFTFTSLVPTAESNQYYLPFTLTLNTNFLQLIDFLRQFEKLPYLTKITSLYLKTPTGIGGPVEISISGKVYVQDAFKN